MASQGAHISIPFRLISTQCVNYWVEPYLVCGDNSLSIYFFYIRLISLDSRFRLFTANAETLLPEIKM